jgi:catechol 2,3-dioxygenase-like lactoylglutathione lyase family enzyme
MTNITLNLIVIRSVDLERSVNFYQRLGLTFLQHRHDADSKRLRVSIDQFEDETDIPIIDRDRFYSDVRFLVRRSG